jgi:LmbE family N-acetylglucosaminyl deacetylase
MEKARSRPVSWGPWRTGDQVTWRAGSRTDEGAALGSSRSDTTEIEPAVDTAERPILVLSPHFDDAVLSCGAWLEAHPGSVVATVCSGRPGPGVAPSEWDADSGFSSGDAAAVARQAEDAAALAMLGATQHVLGFLDGGYREATGRCHEDGSVRGPFKDALAEAFCVLVDALDPQLLVCPMGLLHGDHIATTEAAWSTLRARPDCPLVAYLDLPYGTTNRARLEAAEQRLRSSGLHVGPYPIEPYPTTLKEQAVACYESQLAQLSWVHPGWEKSFNPGVERFFRVLLEKPK